LMYDRTPAGISESKTGISGSRSCTNIQTGVFAYEDICSFRQASLTEVTLRNGINLTDQSIPRGYRRPGRRPHVPSSKPTMSKSRRVSTPGSIGSGHRLYRPRRGAKRRPAQGGPHRRCWGAVYGQVPGPSTAFIANSLQRAVGKAQNIFRDAPRWSLDMASASGFKGRKSLESKNLF